jgi:hypothetical protein
MMLAEDAAKARAKALAKSQAEAGDAAVGAMDAADAKAGRTGPGKGHMGAARCGSYASDVRFCRNLEAADQAVHQTEAAEARRERNTNSSNKIGRRPCHYATKGESHGSWSPLLAVLNHDECEENPSNSFLGKSKGEDDDKFVTLLLQVGVVHNSEPKVEVGDKLSIFRVGLSSRGKDGSEVYAKFPFRRLLITINSHVVTLMPK